MNAMSLARVATFPPAEVKNQRSLRDDGEFARTLAELYPGLLRRARALLGSTHAADAEDLVQDTLARAVTARGQFRYGSSPASWVHTILQRRFLDRCRRARRYPVVTVADPDAAVVGLFDEGEAPWWRRLSLEDVKRAAQKLTPLLREVFLMREIDGLGYAAISARLGILERTVGTRLLRARREVRRLLEQEAERRPTPLPRRDGCHGNESVSSRQGPQVLGAA